MTMKLQNRRPDKPIDLYGATHGSDDISRQVETHVKQLEGTFGRERLLQTISNIKPEAFSQHVTNHRSIIRSGKWPNEDRPSSFEDFCNEYKRAALAYVNVGFEALAFLAGDRGISVEEMHYKVLCAEALRGQFGKRSPTGLDQRLERTTDKLESCLSQFLDGDVLTEKVNILCTPTTPWLSAEAALLEDFHQLHQLFGAPPTMDELLSAAGVHHDVAWSFLRRHVKWNFLGIHRLYSEFCKPEFSIFLNAARTERAIISERYNKISAELAEQMFYDAETEALSFAHEIRVLNKLNLTLEPYFSFKGAPGLPQLLIFQEASKIGLHHQYSPDELNTGKWALFHSTAVKDA